MKERAPSMAKISFIIIIPNLILTIKIEHIMIYI